MKPLFTPAPFPAGEIALFLDVDGTLLRIAATPTAVDVDPAVLDLVERLHRATGGATALISGRSIADIDRLFAPLQLPVAGQHGFERRDAQGVFHRHAGASSELAALRKRFETFAAQHPGVLVEHKGLTLGIHYRLAPGVLRTLTAFAARLAAESTEALLLQPGKMVLEVKPAGKDKGTAIAEFLSEVPFRDRTAVFIGDDLTDEYGFAIVNGCGGITIKVGEEPTAAKARLPHVDAVRSWLEQLLCNLQVSR